MSLYLVVGLAVLVALIAVAISVVSQSRNLAINNETAPDDELGEFKRMFEAGEISEEEYRKMKKIIAEKTVSRIKGE